MPQKASIEWTDYTSNPIVPREGGWVGRRWMTSAELNAALERWVDRSYATALPEALAHGGAYQCGGCRFFGAFDGDYGLCCNPDSENDGRVVFEHGGCPQASGIPVTP